MRINHRNTLSYSISVGSYAESGMFLNVVRTLRKNAFSIFTKENRIYFTINQFKDDMTKFDNLSLGNFRMLFLIFCSFDLILLVVFMGHHAVIKAYSYWLRRRKRLLRRRRRMRRMGHRCPIALRYRYWNLRNAFQTFRARLLSLVNDNSTTVTPVEVQWLYYNDCSLLIKRYVQSNRVHIN